MILGLGLDVVDVVLFAEQLADGASGFVAATFRPSERRRGDPNDPNGPNGPNDPNDPTDPRRRALHLAGRFAAKEAFVKAWSSARRGQPPALAPADLDLRDIEVVDDGFGRPALRLHGPVRNAVERLDEGRPPVVHLSISHDGATAAAVVVLEENATALES
ncbi:MAG TPA: holo-ACP synthase [Acidimicrobiales bacterium]|nr:holo-ACP synthase [Acidimicrobiales bacterium]